MTSRRQFIKLSGAAVLVPLINIPVASAAEKVAADNATAVALKYTGDATNATRTDKMGTVAAMQFCNNCHFYTADAAVSGYGACTLFQNALVAELGWCTGWTPPM